MCSKYKIFINFFIFLIIPVPEKQSSEISQIYREIKLFFIFFILFFFGSEMCVFFSALKCFYFIYIYYFFSAFFFGSGFDVYIYIYSNKKLFFLRFAFLKFNSLTRRACSCALFLFGNGIVLFINVF